jgi:UDP-4-amino-4,6-dideoxy-N-acetyl-beta-L-altrosamine transaminase
MIPYGRQDISQEDIDAVIAVLQSEHLTQGPTVPIFENTVAKYCGANHGVAVNSATSALHIACLALGVGQGDLVWTTPITFVASANCALYCGAVVDFVDIDPLTYNMCAERLAEKLCVAEKNGRLPKVVIPVHLCGQPCNMASIYKLSEQYGFKIIEDASHAIGGKYKGESIGNCRYSDITVFSFHPVKVITTGEGGMAVCNSSVLAKKMRLLRSHGISSSVEDMLARPDQEIWNYQQIDLGFNYRMTDIQAALGISQMKRLDEFVNKRHTIVQLYEQELSGLPINSPWQHPDSYSAFHLYSIRIHQDFAKRNQRHVYEKLKVAGINANLHYIPVYRQPYYQSMGFKVGYCPNAELYFQQTLTVPLYPNLNYVEQTKVIQALRKALV